MSSIMRRRSGLMGLSVAVVWLIGVLLVLEVEVANPLILKARHFTSRYRAPILPSRLDNLSTEVPRVPQAGA